MAEEHWDAAGTCGKCVTVRGIQGRAFTKKYLVKMVDYCTDCTSGDLELAPEVLTLIAGTSQKKRIEWEWAPCTPVEGEVSTSTTGRDFGRKLLTRTQQ